ncbi:MAG TPA: hypothetical protein VL027_08410 [Spongiibacteraceae bacterium]|jgi:chromosome segregation ATPase|nr:hypothetical protein [Spongiibacteraceae bacterium]
MANDGSQRDGRGDGPVIAPARDEIDQFQRQRGNGSGLVPDVPDAGGSLGMGWKLTLLVLLLLVAALSTAAVQFYRQMQVANVQLADYETRVAALEKRLSVTDESLEQSGEAMQVKIRELDVEIRKLWDNVWKRSKEQLTAHEARLDKLDKTLASASATAEANKKQLASDRKTLEALNAQLAKSAKTENAVERIQGQMVTLQALAEGASDRSNALKSSIAKLEQRVKVNEEWVASINAFRRQMNAEIEALKQRP